MKATRNLFLTSLVVAALAAGAWADDSAAAPKNNSEAAASPAPPPVTAADIQALKDALAAQQQQIQALQEHLRRKADQASPHTAPAIQVASTVALATRPAESAPPATANVATTPAPQVAQSGQNSGSSDERIRNLERQIKGLGPISFSGDIRLRGEPFFGGPANESLDRVRGRFRTRFNATADLGEQFRAGFTLASGDINDPTSTNQTFTGFYTRKAVALDQAFLELTAREGQVFERARGKF